jgi:hypothetical protein
LLFRVFAGSLEEDPAHQMQGSKKYIILVNAYPH